LGQVVPTALMPEVAFCYAGRPSAYFHNICSRAPACGHSRQANILSN